MGRDRGVSPGLVANRESAVPSRPRRAERVCPTRWHGVAGASAPQGKETPGQQAARASGSSPQTS